MTEIVCDGRQCLFNDSLQGAATARISTQKGECHVHTTTWKTVAESLGFSCSSGELSRHEQRKRREESGGTNVVLSELSKRPHRLYEQLPDPKLSTDGMLPQI
jgi:hypothetical protein